jgi:hypothetical protein
MIRSLRQRHLQIWLCIALFLPIGILMALVVIPRPVTDHLREPPAAAGALPLLLGKQDRVDYSANLRASTDTTLLQVEWITKTGVTKPTALIFSGDTLLGHVESKGIYRFTFKRPSGTNRRSITLYDIVHHRILDKIVF